ncbi:MAG: hypothetical protein RLZ10_1040 [Bacteroidota bacterium]|jgi:hypothetical protein
MSDEKKEKRCSGCKSAKPLDNFYKNKLVLDGHSNYCIDCTRENSRRYFQKKKERQSKEENDNLMKMVLFSNHSNDSNPENADNLMKVLMIERMCKSILDELENLKKNLVKSKSVEVEVG